MPRKNEYTFVVERPMTRDAAVRNANLFAELFLKRTTGLTPGISVVELRPGEESPPVRLSKDFRAVG